ncbi:MAG: hypothetical protein CTY16_19415 [Methylobacter sp.]|nr:MAG: hypothetical protein CTY16_19415 [Methylobacter sp.]
MNLIETLKTSVKYHFIIEFLLLVIIIFLTVKPRQNINLDTNGLVKNNLLNISLSEEGALVVSHPFANETALITNEKPLNQTALKQLHNMVIAVTEDNNNPKRAENGIFDSIISSATASTMHNIPGHIYLNITFSVDGVVTCRRYDKTLNMKYVGACM